MYPFRLANVPLGVHVPSLGTPALSLALVLHHVTRKLSLQFPGLKMRKVCEIDFLVKHFANRLNCVVERLMLWRGLMLKYGYVQVRIIAKL